MLYKGLNKWEFKGKRSISHLSHCVLCNKYFWNIANNNVYFVSRTVCGWQRIFQKTGLALLYSIFPLYSFFVIVFLIFPSSWLLFSSLFELVFGKFSSSLLISLVLWNWSYQFVTYSLFDIVDDKTQIRLSYFPVQCCGSKS